MASAAHLTQHCFSISKGLRGARANPQHVEATALGTAVAAETDTSGLGAGCKEGLHGAVILQRHQKCPSTLDIDKMFSKP